MNIFTKDATDTQRAALLAKSVNSLKVVFVSQHLCTVAQYSESHIVYFQVFTLVSLDIHNYQVEKIYMSASQFLSDLSLMLSSVKMQYCTVYGSPRWMYAPTLQVSTHTSRPFPSL